MMDDIIDTVKGEFQACDVKALDSFMDDCGTPIFYKQPAISNLG